MSLFIVVQDGPCLGESAFVLHSSVDQQVHVWACIVCCSCRPNFSWVSTTAFVVASCRHEQQTMPASQYKLQSGHCCFEDVSQSSKISVLLMSAMRSCDSLLNSFISFVCLKSWMKDSLFGWFSNFSINCLTLSLRCVSCCSTAERST